MGGFIGDLTQSKQNVLLRSKFSTLWGWVIIIGCRKSKSFV